MIHTIDALPHPDFADCIHKIEVWDINISLKNQEVALVTCSRIENPDGSLRARTEARTVILRAAMDTFVDLDGNFVNGPADMQTIFPEFIAIYNGAFPLLLPFIEKGVTNGIAQNRYW
ncbi:hypothetical protein DYBT9275_00907 [Dyadobacter sp. CECT 9275]|uniref:Uncharacterized protein n=1 Tax=Dyadobacter helix TaxID=2822344 RepID=A0A916N4K6_9BACT|nr:hypothetical protein [Dyadobacter sp. CECT 9275]CAG4992168.1 hypothetical protein DYBT9275_00907 [Dyadobacter sp. CECT 9275]